MKWNCVLSVLTLKKLSVNQLFQDTPLHVKRIS